MATTVATVGKSGNLPVASFEYTFDHVADVDDNDNVDDVGEDDDVDDNFSEVRDEDGDDDADDNVSEVHDDDVSEDDDTDCEGETLETWWLTGLHESLQPCSRAARKWRENEEMRRKWRENEEMERD